MSKTIYPTFTLYELHLRKDVVGYCLLQWVTAHSFIVESIILTSVINTNQFECLEFFTLIQDTNFHKLFKEYKLMYQKHCEYDSNCLDDMLEILNNSENTVFDEYRIKEIVSVYKAYIYARNLNTNFTEMETILITYLPTLLKKRGVYLNQSDTVIKEGGTKNA